MSGPATLPALLAVLVALMSAAIAAAVAHYGRRWLLDHPGRYRSHTTPTPRGGGLGIPLLCVVALSGIAAGSGVERVSRQAWVLAAALAAVAAVGLWDDIRGLPRLPRFAVHLLAATAVAWSLRDAYAGPDGTAATLAIVVVALAVAWSINLHNFMDGANGLLGAQAVFVLGTTACLALAADNAIAATFPAVAAVATLAFLPFNFPHARVFLGDVGSGPLGLAIVIAALLAARADVVPLAGSVVLSSAFIADATLTLALRLLRGRRWYTRHREHLYQWLVRSGLSHARVVALYAFWNFAVALPLALTARKVGPSAGWTIAAATLLVAGLVWSGGRAAALARVRSR